MFYKVGVLFLDTGKSNPNLTDSGLVLFIGSYLKKADHM